MANEPAHFGRMNDPTAAARIKGICGDEMEFYLHIRNHVIEDVCFYTENGCDDTRAAGERTATLAEGREVMAALAINPRQVLEELGFFECGKAQITEGGRHCAILAVSTLYKAIADFLLNNP